MGFSIHVGNQHVLSFFSCHYQFPYSVSNMLAGVCTDNTKFIHAHTDCTALQEKLHECVGWFITRSVGSSDVINCDIRVSSAFIQK